MNHMGTMILCIGSSTGGLVYDYVPGYFYDGYGPTAFLYIEVVCAIVFMIIVCLMTLFVWLRPKRGGDAGDVGAADAKKDAHAFDNEGIAASDEEIEMSEGKLELTATNA